MDEDEMARLRAESEQAHTEVAGELFNFYTELVRRGFSISQAMALTIAFLESQLMRAHGDGDE